MEEDVPVVNLSRRGVVIFVGAVVLFVVAAVLTVDSEGTNIHVNQGGYRERGGQLPEQSRSTGGAVSVPVPLAVLIGLAGPAAAVAAILANNRREAVRLDHERTLKETELEETKLAKLREERLQAYARLNDLAGHFDPKEYVMTDIRAALSQIQLLTDNEAVLRSARSLTGKINSTRRLVRDVKLANPDQDPAEDPTVQSAVRQTEAYRLSFIADARSDLGYNTVAS